MFNNSTFLTLIVFPASPEPSELVSPDEPASPPASDEPVLEESSPSNCLFSLFLGVEGSAVGSSTVKGVTNDILRYCG